MRLISILLLMVGLLNIVSAQRGMIRGQVMDSVSQENLGFATVTLFRQQDSTAVNGALADSLGKFVMKNVPAGKYYMLSSFLGYDASFNNVSLLGGEQKDMGVIGLVPGERLLEEIRITGRTRKSFQTIDRQRYTAEQFRSAQGGTATEILRNLPGISVDALGGISVRGSGGFVVMLDGRQLQMDASTLLNQLPVNAIESIEILTTPSAKYDPDGKAGIIHIQTKSGATDGLYLLVNGLLGMPSIEDYDNPEVHQRWGGDFTVNYKKGKWNVSLGAEYNRDDLGGRRVGYVNTYENEILTEYPSYGERSFDRERYSGRLSVLYKPDSRQQWGLSFYAGDKTQYRTADILYDWQQRTRIRQDAFLGTEEYWNLYQRNDRVLAGAELVDSLTYFNENLRVREGDFLIGALDYSIQIDETNKLSISALYEHTLLGGPTDNSVLSWPNIADTLQYQFNTNDNPLDGVRVKIDYSKKVAGLSWESGYQYRYLSHPGDFLYLDRDLDNDVFVENPLFTNRIELERQIHGLYTQVSGSWDKLEYIAGIRLEYMDREVNLAEPDTLYEYEIVQPFPTLNLQYNLGKGWISKAGYSRRIERTTTFKMTPFPEREHNETLEQGDAELLPEFIDQVELGLVKTWGDNSAFATGYFRHVENVINRVNTVFNDSILNRIYTNAGNAQALGLEVGTYLYPTEGLSFYLGGNIYRYRIKGNLFGDRINTANTIYSINATADWRLSETLSLQGAFNYLSERISAQGRDSRFFNPSLTLRKTFWDGKLAASIQWLSIDMGLWEANEQRITTLRDNFYTTTNYIYEVDRVILNLSFRLNQASKQMKFIESEFGGREF